MAESVYRETLDKETKRGAVTPETLTGCQRFLHSLSFPLPSLHLSLPLPPLS